ncbi:MAG: NADH-quinone oxidoreductase subunit J, partial [Chloroflexi bacterium]|nr:NADH-quinone oxidoreductase subunit J [Chloroflexota bacterium]
MVGTIVFLILAAIAIAAAIGMLTSTNAVHSALFLVINFICVALFYLGLAAPFLAMMQVTVYAGAIMVLFLFVIMLLGAERVSLSSRLRWQTPLAVVLLIALAVVTALLAFSPAVSGSLADPEPVSAALDSFRDPRELGAVLYTEYMLPFQMLSLIHI